MTICVRHWTRLRGAPCPNNPDRRITSAIIHSPMSCVAVIQYVVCPGTTSASSRRSTWCLCMYVSFGMHSNMPETCLFWLNMRTCYFYCCQPSVRARTHARKPEDAAVLSCVHAQTVTGPLIMSNPVLLLVPKYSHVLLAQGWLCSFCIYLSVVQRLRAMEIKSKGQRADGDMSWGLLNSVSIRTWTYHSQ